MNGKSWQRNHEPHVEGTKQAPVTLIKQWKEGEEQTGEGKQPLSKDPMLDTCMIKESSDSVNEHLQCRPCGPSQEHMESWHMHRSKCH